MNPFMSHLFPFIPRRTVLQPWVEVCTFCYLAYLRLIADVLLRKRWVSFPHLDCKVAADYTLGIWISCCEADLKALCHHSDAALWSLLQQMVHSGPYRSQHHPSCGRGRWTRVAQFSKPGPCERCSILVHCRDELETWTGSESNLRSLSWNSSEVFLPRCFS